MKKTNNDKKNKKNTPWIEIASIAIGSAATYLYVGIKPNPILDQSLQMLNPKGEILAATLAFVVMLSLTALLVFVIAPIYKKVILSKKFNKAIKAVSSLWVGSAASLLAIIDTEISISILHSIFR